MEEFFNFIKGFNIQTLAGMAILLWIFTRDLKKEIQSMHDDMKKMNTRISRIEGTVYGSEVYNHLKE